MSFDSWPSERTRQQMRDGLDSLVSAQPEQHRSHFAEWLRSTVTNVRTFETEALPHYLDIISGPVGQASFFQHQVMHYDPRHTADLSHRLPELRDMPVQNRVGRRRRVAGRFFGHIASTMRSRAPPSPSYPTVVHFAMEDQPDAVNAAIIGFLQGDAPG